MTPEQLKELTDAQRTAMRDLQTRSGIPWPEFLESAQAPTPLSSYVGIPNFHGMYVGIETDGYTHS